MEGTASSVVLADIQTFLILYLQLWLGIYLADTLVCSKASIFAYSYTLVLFGIYASDHRFMSN